MPDLWPYPPLTPITERLGFKTDVLEAYSAEQRVALREFPRQSFTLQCRMTPVRMAAAAALIRDNDGDTWYLPIWHELSRPGAIGSSDTTISVDTTIADYRAGDQALVWESPESYTLVTVQSLNSTTLTLSGAVGTAYTAPAVMPVRTAFLRAPADVMAQIPTGDVSMSFEVIDNKDLGSQPYDTYDSLPALIGPPLHESGVTASMMRRPYFVDNDVGLVTRVNRLDYFENVAQMTWRDDGASARWDRRTFLHHIKGRQKAFWSPSWRTDLVLASDIGASDTTITVNSIGASTVYGSRRIVIRLLDGTRFYRAVSYSSSASGNDILSIGTSLGQAVAASDVRMISFLSKSRLDTDRIEMAHHLEGFTDTSATVREVPA